MPFDMPENIVLAIHYIAFAGQIYLISRYFPARLAARIRHVITNYPVEEYPKLYPGGGPGYANIIESKTRLFLNVNTAIALAGAAILVAMIAKGYSVDPKGGDEIFVMFYFMLQMVPFMVAGVKEHTQYRAMWRAFSEPRRQADLRRRRLFDFVSPLAVFGALACYTVWLVFYLDIKGWSGPWGEEVYISIGVTTAMNVAYAAIIARFIYGRKLDPYQASKDHHKTVAAVTQILVYSSIGISLFHIVSVAADEYALEAFDPVFSSLYMQFCAALGLGITMGSVKVEELDYSVYRTNGG